MLTRQTLSTTRVSQDIFAVPNFQLPFLGLKGKRMITKQELIILYWQSIKNFDIIFAIL